MDAFSINMGVRHFALYETILRTWVFTDLKAEVALSTVALVDVTTIKTLNIVLMLGKIFSMFLDLMYFNVSGRHFGFIFSFDQFRFPSYISWWKIVLHGKPYLKYQIVLQSSSQKKETKHIACMVAFKFPLNFSLNCSVRESNRTTLVLFWTARFNIWDVFLDVSNVFLFYIYYQI